MGKGPGEGERKEGGIYLSIYLWTSYVIKTESSKYRVQSQTGLWSIVLFMFIVNVGFVRKPEFQLYFEIIGWFLGKNPSFYL